MPINNPGSVTSNLTVLKNGSTVGTRPTLNIIEGSSIAVTAVDNAGATEVDLTIASSAGGSSAAGAYSVGTLSSFGEGSITAEATYFWGSAFNNVGAWPSANLAMYVPVQLLTTVTAYGMFWFNGATVGTNTVDCAIYNEAGTTKIAFTGATLTAGATATQFVSFGSPMTLTPDTYQLAMLVNGTTDTFQRGSISAAIMRFCGLRQQAVGAGTLPSTATFATWSQAMHPYFGVDKQNATF